MNLSRNDALYWDYAVDGCIWNVYKYLDVYDRNGVVFSPSQFMFVRNWEKRVGFRKIADPLIQIQQGVSFLDASTFFSTHDRLNLDRVCVKAFVVKMFDVESPHLKTARVKASTENMLLSVKLSVTDLIDAQTPFKIDDSAILLLRGRSVRIPLTSRGCS